MVSREELDRIIERIQKLLALSTSSNPHEAALAAAKAQALLFRHNLSMATVQAGMSGSGGSPYVVDRYDLGGSTNWRRMLLGAVARNNFCRAVWYRGTRDVGIVGEPHNIAAVQYLYEFLMREIRRLADRAWEEGGYARRGERERTWKRSFYFGAVQTVSERLAAQREADARADTASLALTVVKDRELDEAYRQHFGAAGKARKAVVRSTTGYAAGVRAARKIALNRPLGEAQRAAERELLPSG